MGIRRHIKVAPTGVRRPDDTGVYAIMTESHISSGDTFPVQQQYRLSLSVQTDFWANDAQLDRARQRAERALLQMVYREILPRVDLAIHAIANRDTHRALDELEQIRLEILGN